jgi:stress response protein YsnF
VHVDVTREAVKSSPEYHPGMDVDAAYEARLREVYGRSTQTTSRSSR